MVDTLYGPYHQVVSQPTPVPPPIQQPATTAKPAVDPFAALMQAMLAPGTKTPTFDFPALLTALRNDPVGDRNKQSAFDTGFFKTAAQRFEVEQDRGPVGSYANAPTRTATDYAEETPATKMLSLFGHAVGLAPHVGPTLLATKRTPGPLASLFSQLGRDSKQFYANDPRYAR